MINDGSILYQQDVYACFIVYKKAFDRVRRAYLFQMLETTTLTTTNAYTKTYTIIKNPPSIITTFLTGIG